MTYLTTLALTLYVSGVFISKEITQVGQLLLIIPILKSIFDCLQNKKISLPRSAYFLVVFVIIAIFTIHLNPDNVRPSKLYYPLRAPILGIFLILVLDSWIREASDQLKRWAINLFFLSLLISAGYGIFMYLKYNQDRLYGFIHIMKQGYGSALVLSVLIPAILHREKIKHFFSVRMAIVTASITFLVMLLTQTRGAMLGLVCATPFILFYYRKKWGYYGGLLSLVCVISIGGYYLFGTSNTNTRFITTKENNSDSIRRSIWLASLYMIKEQPLVGWGYLNTKDQFKRIKEKYDLPRKDVPGIHTHNNFLEVAAGTGLFGFMAFCGWLFFWISETCKGSNFNKGVTIPFLIVFIISSQFEITIDHRLAILVFFFYSLSSLRPTTGRVLS